MSSSQHVNRVNIAKGTYILVVDPEVVLKELLKKDPPNLSFEYIMIKKNIIRTTKSSKKAFHEINHFATPRKKRFSSRNKKGICTI